MLETTPRLGTIGSALFQQRAANSIVGAAQIHSMKCEVDVFANGVYRWQTSLEHDCFKLPG